MYFSKVRKIAKVIDELQPYDERKGIEYFIAGVSCEILQIKEEKFMSMKRVLAAFMGVTLMVGNDPVSVLAEETEQAAEAAASTQIVNLETQGRTNQSVWTKPIRHFPGRWSQVRSVLPRRRTRSWYRIRKEM